MLKREPSETSLTWQRTLQVGALASRTRLIRIRNVLTEQEDQLEARRPLSSGFCGRSTMQWQKACPCAPCHGGGASMKAISDPIDGTTLRDDNHHRCQWSARLGRSGNSTSSAIGMRRGAFAQLTVPKTTAHLLPAHFTGCPHPPTLCPAPGTKNAGSLLSPPPSHLTERNYPAATTGGRR